MINTRVTELEAAIKDLLERRGASSDHGCSALANVLLTTLVKCRKDPNVRANVTSEMHRLAAKITELANAEHDALGQTLADAGVSLH